MCGISGLLNLKGTPVSRGVLERMIATLAYRGPDESAIVIDSNVGLAHARLSIIDVAGGQQPMSVENGAVTITFNGEIFNYIELREELIRRGHRFATESDTEVILRSYLERAKNAFMTSTDNGPLRSGTAECGSCFFPEIDSVFVHFSTHTRRIISFLLLRSRRYSRART